MKKTILAVGILLISSFSVSTVYAGTLNEYENEIISAAKKTYEYDGVNYQVDMEYISQLVEYLSTDDINLTAGQRDEVLQMAFDSIEDGVQKGYLVPVIDVDAQEVTASVGSNFESSISDDTSTDITFGNSDSSDKNADDTDVSVEKEETTPKELIVEILNEGQGDKSIVDTATGLDNISHDNTYNNIIKNTGFDFTNTILVIAGMGMLMLIGISVTIRQNLFAHKDV